MDGPQRSCSANSTASCTRSYRSDVPTAERQVRIARTIPEDRGALAGISRSGFQGPGPSCRASGPATCPAREIAYGCLVAVLEMKGIVYVAYSYYLKFIPKNHLRRSRLRLDRHMVAINPRKFIGRDLHDMNDKMMYELHFRAGTRWKPPSRILKWVRNLIC